MKFPFQPNRELLAKLKQSNKIVVFAHLLFKLDSRKCRKYNIKLVGKTI